MHFIDLAAQQRRIREGIEARMRRVLDHGRYILGPEIRELEDRLAAYVGVPHAVTCSSGTDALLMALMALGVGPGDEVVTVPYTWISTAEVVALLGARPVFIDILPDTLTMDPDRIEAAITGRTRAILPVSLYGQCADMTRIGRIARGHGLPVVEDAAQSFGAAHRGRRSCALSTIGCTSFFPSKPLGCYGDGGALFTRDDGLAETLRQVRVHGQRTRHQHPVLGINGRMDTLQAAVLLEKMTLFEEECAYRAEAARRYDALLSGIPGIRIPFVAEGNASVYGQYTVLCEDRDTIARRCREAGIPTVAYYAVPLHLQGAFRDHAHRPGDFPVAEAAAARGLSLPMHPYIEPEDQERVASVIRSAAASAPSA